MRAARVEALRFRLAMGLLGFVGGLMLVLPAVFWLVPPSHSRIEDAFVSQTADPLAGMLKADSAPRPGLVVVPTRVNSVPTRADREPAAPAAPVESGPPRGEAEVRAQLDKARALIRSGDVLAARRILSDPRVAGAGEALFVLAETYDPNVLAAIGATGILAETEAARRHYEAALAKGIDAAARRLEALE